MHPNQTRLLDAIRAKALLNACERAPAPPTREQIARQERWLCALLQAFDNYENYDVKDYAGLLLDGIPPMGTPEEWVQATVDCHVCDDDAEMGEYLQAWIDRLEAL